ncbi:hypothetical protein RhiirA4_470954 [Rhizophagus irregularis]|uniref:Uncharacterized protein n=1 Tax=Rhizophagus irregularis TaxID=588596 RepID=A0A2I1H288_9GLOM|nr:hypothetical protein RhiirA4_470954 [Rhizophagus irregularis]
MQKKYMMVTVSIDFNKWALRNWNNGVEMLKIGKKNGAKSSGYSWLFLAILGYS